MSLHSHAERELKALGYGLDSEDGPDKWMYKCVMELIDTFAAQKHSGSSAPCCLSLFEQLVSYKSLSPLQGGEDEWINITDMAGRELWQNNRCYSVFKEADGKAYNMDGKVFREPNGACYTNSNSHVYITFPYTPTTEYVDVPFKNEGE